MRLVDEVLSVVFTIMIKRIIADNSSKMPSPKEFLNGRGIFAWTP